MVESGVTAKMYRHRTTIPSEVFHALGLRDKDRLRWTLLRNGTVVVEKVGR
jgi:bifunctional DNA-binding transcriptional regulator/antitoxin component of YhaV-PrlF toxin-antitoxin module